MNRPFDPALAANRLWRSLSPEARARLLTALYRDVREARFERPTERTR